MKLDPLSIKIGVAILCVAGTIALIVTAAMMGQNHFVPPSPLHLIVPSPPTIVKDATFLGILAAIVTFLFWLLVFVICYILPTIVAMTRNHCDKRTIIVLNLLLGWTGITWLVVMTWSLGSPNPRIVFSVPLSVTPPATRGGMPAAPKSQSLKLGGNPGVDV